MISVLSNQVFMGTSYYHEEGIFHWWSLLEQVFLVYLLYYRNMYLQVWNLENCHQNVVLLVLASHCRILPYYLSIIIYYYFTLHFYYYITLLSFLPLIIFQYRPISLQQPLLSVDQPIIFGQILTECCIIGNYHYRRR